MSLALTPGPPSTDKAMNVLQGWDTHSLNFRSSSGEGTKTSILQAMDSQAKRA